MNTKNILITGFEVFGGYQYNPSQDIAKELDGQNYGNINFHGLVLPAIYNAFPFLQEATKDKKNPISGIISLGLSSSVQAIRLENRGLNKNDSPYKDNNGLQLFNTSIYPAGRDYHKINLDNKSLKLLLKDNNIPCEISDDPGGFICNDLIYRTMRYITTETKRIPFCFIHIPWTDNYKDKINIAPNKIMLPKEQIITAIKLIADHI